MNSHNPMNIAADFAKATGGTARKVVALTDKGPLNGFKKFLSRGSMIDMAVGVVMGSAVTAVVNSIVDNLISPLIGPDVYLEVQHPCWSCNSNSSSANASAGVR